MQKTMMILGAGPLQLPAIKKAKELGYRLILVDYDEQAVGFPLADIKLVVSTLDQEEVYRQALIYQPDVVLTSTSDGPVRTAAYVNEKLGKQPDLAYEDAVCATMKNQMRDRLREKGIPIPAYFAVKNVEEFKEAVDKLNGFCMVKPSDSAGSRGVILLRGEEDLSQVYEYSRSCSRNGILMVEEFMEGPEVSVEAITVKGQTTILTVTDKWITPPPYFVELAHSEPSRLEEGVQEKIREITLQAVKAIGIVNAPSHTEIKVTSEGPKIVEVAARLGGDFITSRLVPLSTGIDMVENSLLLAIGEQVDLTPKKQQGAAICFLGSENIQEEIQKGKVLHSMEADPQIYQIEGIEEVVLYKKPGETIKETQSSHDRLGHVIATGKDAQEAMERAKRAISMIQIRIT